MGDRVSSQSSRMVDLRSRGSEHRSRNRGGSESDSLSDQVESDDSGSELRAGERFAGQLSAQLAANASRRDAGEAPDGSSPGKERGGFAPRTESTDSLPESDKQHPAEGADKIEGGDDRPTVNDEAEVEHNDAQQFGESLSELARFVASADQQARSRGETPSTDSSEVSDLPKDEKSLDELATSLAADRRETVSLADISE